jgi:methylenetetrahydrofolate dehydrogenase (NADP+)/methenyltetrahydrofolate cyclohydrolase
VSQQSTPHSTGAQGASASAQNPTLTTQPPAGEPARGSLIDGVALAKQYRKEISARALAIRERGGAGGGVVRLDALLIDHGDNAARVYAENQGKTCRELGIDYRLHTLPSGSGYDDVAGRVLLLNTMEDVHAIMVHLPMPEGVDAYSVQRLIAPEKDVEGVNPANIGNVVYGRSSLAPCTALAVIKMIESVLGKGQLRGKHAVVVGAGDVVGKPIAVLLMRQDATVVSCNKFTRGIEAITRHADVLVAAAGVPGLITRDMVKPGAVVIDVGVNRVTGPDGKTRTVGDVAFEQVRPIAGWISPVPGGVGPMTVAMLLLNVVESAERRVRLPGAPA